MCDWVKCPYCGEPDMRMERGIVTCLNLSCPGTDGRSLNLTEEEAADFNGRELPFYSNTDRSLWEILVPTIRNDGRPIRVRFHRVWDEKIRAISGGLSILAPARGQWINTEGRLFTERMIPVRLLATRVEIEKIIDMTMEYYDQEAVLAYKISDEVILKSKPDV